MKSRRWASHVARIGERRSVYMALVGKPEGGGRFGRSRLKWEDDIKMDLHEWYEGVDWIDLAKDRDRWRVLVSAKQKRSETLPATSTGHYTICCKNLSLALLKIGKSLPETC
jgi:hypothetical protein